MTDHASEEDRAEFVAAVNDAKPNMIARKWMTAPLDVEGILAEAEAATAPPWRPNGIAQTLIEAKVRIPLTAEQARLDGLFIAHARTNVPALCREVLSLQSENAALREAAVARPHTAGDEVARSKHMAEHYRKLLTVTKNAWLHAAQVALDGDMRAIRNRVELAGEPVEFIEQSAESQPLSNKEQTGQ